MPAVTAAGAGTAAIPFPPAPGGTGAVITAAATDGKRNKITFGEDLSVERPSLFTLPPFVFFSGGDPAAYMALGLVFVEDFLDLLVQVPVDGRQAFTEVLM